MSVYKQLSDRIAAPEILVAPGVYDAFSAWRAQSLGFEAVFLSGSAVAMMHLGRPDIGLLTLPEMAEITGRVADRVDIPIFVDADQGFGNAAMAARTMQMLERAGAAGIQMEDQQSAKPSRAMLSRPLVSTEEMVDKIKAALDVRNNAGLMLSARCDAAAQEGVEAALDRAAAYAAAGADMIFVENLTRKTEMTMLVDRIGLQKPLLHNLLRTGEEVQDAATLQQMGYSVALFPGIIPSAVGVGIDSALAALAVQSKVANNNPSTDRINSADYLNSFRTD
ncbi:MAG: isocitrate lyase/phosphoenolpyruvate mutase family protein [Parasphingorhabdus sp.]|uniref:isocitrate lyase/PEP mutase family protein n=1 Tax=Parasphingorhabdus sp. TaxID=2709688 RepID=UPI003296E51D